MTLMGMEPAAEGTVYAEGERWKNKMGERLPRGGTQDAKSGVSSQTKALNMLKALCARR
jgi:hypothetical protein